MVKWFKFGLLVWCCLHHVGAASWLFIDLSFLLFPALHVDYATSWRVFLETSMSQHLVQNCKMGSRQTASLMLISHWPNMTSHAQFIYIYIYIYIYTYIYICSWIRISVITFPITNAGFATDGSESWEPTTDAQQPTREWRFPQTAPLTIIVSKSVAQTQNIRSGSHQWLNAFRWLMHLSEVCHVLDCLDRLVQKWF